MTNQNKPSNKREYSSFDEWYLDQMGGSEDDLFNPFKVGDVVDYRHSTDHKAHGRVASIACFGATTSGGNTCNRHTCTHTDKFYVWVEWPGGKGFSYRYTELNHSTMEIARTRFNKLVKKPDKEPRRELRCLGCKCIIDDGFDRYGLCLSCASVIQKANACSLCGAPISSDVLKCGRCFAKHEDDISQFDFRSYNGLLS